MNEKLKAFMSGLDPDTKRTLSLLATVALPKGSLHSRSYQRAVRALRDHATDPDAFEDKLVLAGLPKIGIAIKSHWVSERNGISILRDERYHLESVAITSRTWAEGMGLPPREYAVLFIRDLAGARHTLIGDDPDYIRLMQAATDVTLANIKVPPVKFFLRRKGWPSEWV